MCWASDLTGALELRACGAPPARIGPAGWAANWSGFEKRELKCQAVSRRLNSDSGNGLGQLLRLGALRYTALWTRNSESLEFYYDLHLSQTY